MAEEMLVHCDCGRRYMRIAEVRSEIESGFALCRCERSLGEWSGLMRYTFEPETEGLDDEPPLPT